jgi:DNA-binding transcriptional LysR family regulator
MSVTEIRREPVLLALAPDHPLAGRADIQASDLDDLPWVALPEALNPQARRRFLDNCRACGFTPDIQMEVDDLLAALRLVSAGLGGTFVQSSLRETLPGRLVFRDIPWFPSSVTIYAVWRKGDPKPLVSEFRQALSDYIDAEH